MPDLNEIVKQIREDADLEKLSRDPFIQFGSEQANRVYLGAQLLPEMPKERERFEEDDLQFKTVIADDAGKYSPTKPKQKEVAIDREFSMGHFSLKRQIDSSQLDAIIRMLDSNSNDAVRGQILGLIRQMVQVGLMEKKELQRWQAITDAQVQITKSNGAQKTIQLIDPPGHRFNAPFAFADDTENPFDVVYDGCETMRDAGYEPRMIISGNRPINLMKNNEQVRGMVTGNIRVDNTNTLSYRGNRLSSTQLNDYFLSEGIPPITQYNLKYHTQTGYNRFLRNDCIVIIGATPRMQTLIIPTEFEQQENQELLMDNLLGYYAVGTPAGQTSPGDKYNVMTFEDHPPRMEVEGVGVGFPAILEDEAIIVINLIDP